MFTTPRRLFTAAALIACAGLAYAQDADPHAGHDHAAPADGEAPVTAEDQAAKDAIKTFGWMVAQQTAVVMEFDKEELALFLEGYNEAFTSDDTMDDRQADLQAMGAYLQTRMMMLDAKQAAAATAENEKYFAELDKQEGIQKTASGLRYKILEAGDDVRATDADSVTLHYEGTLTDGTVFDASRQHPGGQPATFGVGQVVPGFSEGVKLVGNGGSAMLYIPGNLGYGPNPPPNSGITPNAVLVFKIEMQSIDKQD